MLADRTVQMTAAFRLQVAGRCDLVASEAYRFERRIFEQFYGIGPDAHDAEFAAFNARSVFVSVTDALDNVVGHMRLIHPGPDPVAEPVKTVVEAALQPWFLDIHRSIRAAGIDAHRTWDVGTLAVDRSIGRNRTLVLGALYHALVRLAEANDIRHLLMTVDERVRTTLRLVGLPTTALPGARPLPWCGSAASTPVWGNCDDMLAHQRRHNPEAHRLVRLGVGLGDVALPTDPDAYLLGALGPFAVPAVSAAPAVPVGPAVLPV
ncbi:hypothetical protein GCM10027265_37100 [Jatrophihabitans fulvus]